MMRRKAFPLTLLFICMTFAALILLGCGGGEGSSQNINDSNSKRLTPPVQEYVLRFANKRLALAPLDQALDMGNKFTIEAWIFPEEKRNGIIIGKFIGNGDNSCPSYLIQTTENASKLEFVTAAGNCSSFTSVTSLIELERHAWTHFAAILGNGVMKLYIDGKESGSTLSPGAPINGNIPLAIGSGYNSSYYWDGFPGAIAQIRIWDRILTESEIRHNSDKYLNGDEDGLVAYWPLDDGKGLEYRDMSKNNLILKGQADLLNSSYNLGPHWALTNILNNGPYFTINSVTASMDDIWNGGLIDINNDGDLDLIALSNPGMTLEPKLIFSNDGFGNFRESTTEVLGEEPILSYTPPREQVIYDFNSDGLTDVFIPEFGCDGTECMQYSGQSRILIQSNDGMLIDETDTRLPIHKASTHAAIAGDIDNDSDIDILMCNFSGTVQAQLYGNDGTGHFTILSDNLPINDLMISAVSCEFIDIEKDGDLDLVLGLAERGIVDDRDLVLLNDGNGYFSEANYHILPPRHDGEVSTNFDIDAVDFNGDGWSDLMTAPLHGADLNFPIIQFMINNKDGTFSDLHHQIPMNFLNRTGEAWLDTICPFDINQDGWIDFGLRGAGEYMESFIYLNRGDAIFIEISEILPHFEGKFLEQINFIDGDIDNDGDIDLILLMGQNRFLVAKSIKQVDIGTSPLTPPGTPTLVSPTNGLTVGKSPVLIWNENGPTTSSHVQIATDSTFNNIVFQMDNVTSNSLTPRLKATNTHYWRVMGINTGGASLWSEPWSFDTENYAPTSIELSSNIIVEYSTFGTTVGQFQTIDIDGGDTHTYSFATGDGTNDADNDSFIIDGDLLKSNLEINYSTTPTYNIYVRSGDGFGGTVEQAFTIEVIQYGLVTYYPFNGNANDESGNANHGAVNGAMLTSDRLGIENSAYSFDGIDDLVDLGSGLGLVNNSDKLTFAAWIYPYEVSSEIGRQYTILGERDGGDNYQFAVMDNHLWFTFWSNGNEYNFGGNYGSIEANHWQFVTVTYDGVTVRFYIDGVLDGYFGASGNIDMYDSTLFIGTFSNDGMFNGKIDDLMVFNRALSGTEIINLFNEGAQSP